MGQIVRSSLSVFVQDLQFENSLSKVNISNTAGLF